MHSGVAQWEWAGGIPLSEFSTVGSTGPWVFVNGLYGGDKIAYSSDAGETWHTSNALSDISCFTMMPFIGDTLLAAENLGVMSISTDAGATWSRSDSGLADVRITAIAFSQRPADRAHGVLVAATASSGVYRSTDAGLHWSASNNGLLSLHGTSIVASDSVILFGTADREVFRSLDQGLTWSFAGTGVPDTNIIALAAMNGRMYAAGGNSVYESTDHGATWASIPDTLLYPVVNLVLVPTSGQGRGVALFAVTGMGTYRLAHGDLHWTLVSPPGMLSFEALSVTAVHTSLYRAETQRITRSDDLGQTWFPVGSFGVGGYVVAGHISSKNAHPRLYAGAFVSSNHGGNWKGMLPVSDLSGAVSFSVSCDTSASGYDKVIIGTDSGRVEWSTDGGQSWDLLRVPDEPSQGYGVYDVTELDGVVFASLQGSNYFHYANDSIAGVYRTTNAGGSWEKMNTAGLTDTLVVTLDVFRGKTGDRVLFAGAWKNLYRSTNDGASWSENTLTPVHTGRKLFREVNGVVYLCTLGSTIVEYRDDGLPVFTTDSARVYRSSDDGVTWDDITGDLHPRFINGFTAASIPQYPSRTFLSVSKENVVFTSSEGGNRWKLFSDGWQWWPGVGTVGADDRYVYARVNGLQRRPWMDAVITSTPAVEARPPAFSLGQNYPNPFNPTTTIRYELATHAMVVLTMFNTIGQEVALLQKGEQDAGAHEVTFDARGLASGVYFYRLQARPSGPALRGEPSNGSGLFMETRKLVLVR